MSIYSNPFPHDGKDNCPSVGTAEIVLLVATIEDGSGVLGHDFDGMTDWEALPGTNAQRPRLKTGLGINKVRKAVARLWDRMSKKAKARFLASQYSNAVVYLQQCLENIRGELGEVNDGKLLNLPSSNELLGEWL